MKVSPVTTIVPGGRAPGGIGSAEDAMTFPELPREIGVPDMVIAEPPSVRVVPLTMTAVGFAVKV